MANSKEIIAIGDTGDELVSKLASNFSKVHIGNFLFNVEDYGAVHNGTTDDTAAIQATINACHDAGGGTVWFPGGTYLIAGSLQNGISCTVAGSNYDVDFNSQIYIKPDPGSVGKRMIVLEGETTNPYSLTSITAPSSRIILNSTIAGTGIFPSVIGTGKAGSVFPINNITIKNINIVVAPFLDDGGISMCGINLYYSAHNVIDNVFVGNNLLRPYSTAAQPTNHTFGICTGMGNGNFPIIRNAKVWGGFYYGFIIGDGVHAYDIVSFWNYIGLMSAFGTQCGSIIDYACLHWNTFDIAAQQEALFGVAATRTKLYINHLNREVNEGYGPAWTYNPSVLLDTNNYLEGYCHYHPVPQGTPLIKDNGGKNFLFMDKTRGTRYWWTTDTRPTIPAMGYNETTGKYEALTGSGWVDLH
jgi:hypothetical protein